MIVPDIANQFFPMMVRGAEDAAQKHGHNLLLCNSDDTQEKEENALELLLSKRVDGILAYIAEDWRMSRTCAKTRGHREPHRKCWLRCRSWLNSSCVAWRTRGLTLEAPIRKLNYRPNLLARGLAAQKTHTIGALTFLALEYRSAAYTLEPNGLYQGQIWNHARRRRHLDCWHA